MVESDTSLECCGDRSPAKVDALKHATRLIRQVCRGSGFLNVIGNARRSLREQGVAAAVRDVNGGQDRYRMRRRVSRLSGLTVGVVMDRV
ncbi:MAG TPA: hypothetical protein VH230_11110 [Stellaceae bacterium]|nr:hypothetical protein [Stellaceae bacterium]